MYEKTGVAKDSRASRYKGNPLANQWNTVKEVRTKNANYLEKLEQGNERRLGKRVFDYASNKGKTSGNPLGEGRTEVNYKNPTDELFGKKSTGTNLTPVQQNAVVKSKVINANNPAAPIADKVREKAGLKTKTQSTQEFWNAANSISLLTKGSLFGYLCTKAEK